MTEKVLSSKWQFIDSGASDGFLNMAIDEAILNTHLSDSVPPTLRVYRWSTPALSLGYFQDLEREVDQERCSELGIDVVRRLTGGRAVFHHDELTYSVVVSEKYGFPQSIAESYRILCQGLIAAYRILGIEVHLIHSEKGISSPACFTSSTSADLAFRGRKIAGSAQFRRGSALLQHGSLPVSLDAELLFSLLKFPSNIRRDKSLAAFNQKTTSLNGASEKRVDWQTLQDALFTGFQQALNITLYEDVLSMEETDLSQRLVREKYRTSAWNYNGREEESMKNAITANA